MNTNIDQIESKMNELAAKVLEGEHLGSFLLLPLDGKVAGIKFFAMLSNDKEVINICDKAKEMISS